MVNSQSVKPDHIELVNDAPINDSCDITWRYRNGYDRLRNKGFDVIFLMEDDDYYAVDYIETMVNEWVNHGKPSIFGTNYTIYYNLRVSAWFTFHHITRSSAMSTMLIPDLIFPWCVDTQPYTDMHLWRMIKGITFKPSKHICLGMKHGTTVTGGRSHVDRLQRYINQDHQKDFLRSNMDAESFNFFSNFIKK
jgi:hypothetical protein